jgi:hypothetical protein
MENEAAERPAADAPKKPKLTRLKIESFRNVEPCELRFGDGFNVLLGLNATGKTTLLELIAAALSFDFSKFEDEAFAVEYDLEFSLRSVTATVKSERVQRSPIANPRNQLPGQAMFDVSTRLQFRITGKTETWTVCADSSSIWPDDNPDLKLSVRSHLGANGPGILLTAIAISRRESPGDSVVEELMSWRVARRFDEALDMFRGITSPTTWLGIAVDRPNSMLLSFDFGGVIPGELIAAAHARVLIMARDAQGLTIPADSLGLIEQVGALFGFKTGRLEIRLESKLSGPVEHLKFSDFRFMFEAHDGSVIRHEDLSYGQKRLLAFYYYLAASPMTVIADELVDGLHHLWIDEAITAIGDRQAFLASQNPLLLDHLEFDSAEQVASTFITCRTERVGDDKRMSWSNMSPNDAERFFRAYQVDVKHVSEILLSKGLW